MRGVNETREGVCLCTTDRHHPPSAPFSHPNILNTLRYLHTFVEVLASTPPPYSSRGLFLFILRRVRHFPSCSLHPFHIRREHEPSPALAARGSTTVFHGVNKVNAGANSVYFALFFQKSVCKREWATAYRGKCGQTTSSYSTDLLSFHSSYSWIDSQEKRFYLLVAT